METVKKFEINGRLFKIIMIYSGYEWRLKVFMDEKPLDIGGQVSDESVQDGQSAGFGDFRDIIAKTLEDHIRNSRDAP